MWIISSGFVADAPVIPVGDIVALVLLVLVSFPLGFLDLRVNEAKLFIASAGDPVLVHRNAVGALRPVEHFARLKTELERLKVSFIARWGNQKNVTLCELI